MAARAPKYEQVATTEPGTAAAPAPSRTWSAKGNLWKMFVALIVVVGVYVSFTLLREEAAVDGTDFGTHSLLVTCISQQIIVCIEVYHAAAREQ